MVKVIFGLILVVILSSIVFGSSVQSVYAIKTINDTSTGGDCQSSSIGTWNAATRTCTLSSDLSEGVVIGNNNIILDGNGHTIAGTSGNGITVQYKTDITIKNITIKNFDTGIKIDNGIRVTLSTNTFSNNNYGISAANSNTITASGNTFSNNNYEIYVANSNTITA